ncbi:MAG: DUF6941 family protein [Streptosporangiaceae bacterium]
MPASQGPYLSYALLCEKVLREADGVVSFIRAVDHVTVTVPLAVSVGDETAPAATAATPSVALTLAIGLKSGNYVGSAQVKVRIEPPSGSTWPEFDTSLRFEGQDQGAGIILPIQFPVQDEGLYWFSVEVSGEILTRVPLRVTRLSVRQTIPPQQG